MYLHTQGHLCASRFVVSGSRNILTPSILNFRISTYTFICGPFPQIWKTGYKDLKALQKRFGSRHHGKPKRQGPEGMRASICEKRVDSSSRMCIIIIRSEWAAEEKERERLWTSEKKKFKWKCRVSAGKNRSTVKDGKSSSDLKVDIRTSITYFSLQNMLKRKQILQGTDGTITTEKGQ